MLSDFSQQRSTRIYHPIASYSKSIKVMHYWCCGLLHFDNDQRECLSINHISELDNHNLESVHEIFWNIWSSQIQDKYHGLTRTMRQWHQYIPMNYERKMWGVTNIESVIIAWEYQVQNVRQLFEWIAYDFWMTFGEKSCLHMFFFQCNYSTCAIGNFNVNCNEFRYSRTKMQTHEPHLDHLYLSTITAWNTNT